MTVNRRHFLAAALPPSLLALLPAPALTGNLQWLLAAGQQTALGAVVAPVDTDRLVLMRGDDIPRSPLSYVTQLRTLVERYPQPSDKAVADTYQSGGAVTQLEMAFAALLGKEDAVFMPTGTMANHIALRLLCGEARHALVQQESHVYRDEADAVTTLSGINLVPLAPGKAAPGLDEIKQAIERAEVGPYPIKVGALSLESPVRRADGATLPPALIADIAAIAKAKGIAMHLDGARLLLMSGMPGFDIKNYCAPFDTVYVSLYKYLGAPYGAILSGPKALMARARGLRHLFGGTMLHAWQAALPALDALNGVEQRWAAVRGVGERLLAGLDQAPGFTVRRVEHGSNIAFVDIASERQAGLAARLQQAQIVTGRVNDGKLGLTFNETMLRRDTAYLLAAFTGR